MPNLQNRKVAILAADGFEEAELFSPKDALEQAGATVDVISLESGDIQGLRTMERGRTIAVDRVIDDADINDYSAIMIPGGLFSPDTLRRNEKSLAFVRGAFAKALPVASICHGPQVLISAEVVDGRTMTGFEAIQIDLKNAGATVKDEPVVVDQGLVTSRHPDDLDAFNRKLIEEIAEGKHAEQRDSIAA